MKKLQGILIDPITKTLTISETSNDLQGLYDIIGCRCIDSVTIVPQGMGLIRNMSVVMWVDDEGLLHPDGKGAFVIETEDGKRIPIAGRGYITLLNGSGNTESYPESVFNSLPIWQHLITFIDEKELPKAPPIAVPTKQRTVKDWLSLLPEPYKSDFLGKMNKDQATFPAKTMSEAIMSSNPWYGGDTEYFGGLVYLFNGGLWPGVIIPGIPLSFLTNCLKHMSKRLPQDIKDFAKNNPDLIRNMDES